MLLKGKVRRVLNKLPFFSSGREMISCDLSTVGIAPMFDVKVIHHPQLQFNSKDVNDIINNINKVGSHGCNKAKTRDGLTLTDVFFSKDHRSINHQQR
jgi:spore coat protein CotH